MSRINLFIIAAIFSTSVAAEWTHEWAKLGDQKLLKNKDIELYIDKDSIEKSGDRAVVWTVRDYGYPMPVGNKNHLSSKTLELYDCTDKKYKILALYWYSKRQAEGEAVYAEPVSGSMKPIIPNSEEYAIWKEACTK